MDSSMMICEAVVSLIARYIVALYHLFQQLLPWNLTFSDLRACVIIYEGEEAKKMIAWWDSLTTLECIFAYAAIPSTVLLLVQTLLLMTGMVGQHDSDVDMDSDTSGLGDSSGVEGVDLDGDGVPDSHESHSVHDAGLRIITVRGLVAFFAVGGWTGLVMSRGETAALLSSFGAVLAGMVAMVVMAVLLRLALRLQSDGSMDLRNAVGATGTVYLTVPPGRNAKGKVSVFIQSQLRELDAVTDHESAIKSGAAIQVVDVINGNTLVVAGLTKAVTYIAT